jgi:hypothetical protein
MQTTNYFLSQEYAVDMLALDLTGAVFAAVFAGFLFLAITKM